jgi:hypothetical protein
MMMMNSEQLIESYTSNVLYPRQQIAETEKEWKEEAKKIGADPAALITAAKAKFKNEEEKVRTHSEHVVELLSD